jgi:hypothetical protein
LNSYVYVYEDPRTAEVKYIGKGVGNRDKKHLKESHNQRLHRLIKKCQKHQIEIAPRRICTGLSPAAAKAVETFWIKVFDAGCEIFNVDKCNTLPFEPWNKGKKTNQITWMKGKKHKPESIIKMSQSKKGHSAWNKGQTLQKESIEKRTETRLERYGKYGRPMSEEGKLSIVKSWEKRRQLYGPTGRKSK